MNRRVKFLFDEAGKLSPEEREALGEMLLSSVDGSSVDEAWLAEADRRWAELQASGAEAVDAFEALDDAKALLAAL